MSASLRARRVVLGLVGASLVAVGAWAQAFPRSFYDDFPLGRQWVSLDGPYNEHLVRDVGGLNLALAAVVIAVAALGGVQLLRLVALGVLLYSAPHLAYHATHLDVYGAADRVWLIASLTLVVLAPLWVAAVPLSRAPRTTPAAGR